MSVRIMTRAWDADLAPMEKLVLLALADAANDDGICWPSVAWVTRKSGQGERTVRRCIKALCDAGHLSQELRQGTSPIYRVHPCQSGTPAAEAPLPDRPEPMPERHDPPATVAPKPSMKRKEPSKCELPDWLDLPTWEAFKRMRKAIPKVAFTKDAEKLVLSKLTRLRGEGYDPTKLLEKAIEGSWRTVWPHDDCRVSSGNTAKPLTTEELERAIRFRRDHGDEDGARKYEAELAERRAA